MNDPYEVALLHDDEEAFVATLLDGSHRLEVSLERALQLGATKCIRRFYSHFPMAGKYGEPRNCCDDEGPPEKTPTVLHLTTIMFILRQGLPLKVSSSYFQYSSTASFVEWILDYKNAPHVSFNYRQVQRKILKWNLPKISSAIDTFIEEGSYNLNDFRSLSPVSNVKFIELLHEATAFPEIVTDYPLLKLWTIRKNSSLVKAKNES